jgi:hypothetical protein
MTTRPSQDENLVKILFHPNDDHYTTTETLWAEPLGNDTYRLRNTPFYFYGASTEDIVHAAPGSDGLLEFREVVERGGSSTYRIVVREGAERTRFEEYWRPLGDAGCTLEGATARFYAVAVPPETNVDHVVALLAKGEESGVWDWEEGYRHENEKRSLTRPRRREGG